MENIIQLDSVKLSVRDHIIYCDIDNGFDYQSLKVGVTEIFNDSSLTFLSKGKYLPLLINLTEVNNLEAIKLFMFFSQSLQVNISVLSKTFVVRSSFLKIVLQLSSVFCGNVVPNRIFKNFNGAIENCNKMYLVFNVAN